MKQISDDKQALIRPDLIEMEPVAKDYVLEGFESKEAFLKDMVEQYQADVDYDRVNRYEAIDDLRFAAGEQWDPVVLQQRKG